MIHHREEEFRESSLYYGKSKNLKYTLRNEKLVKYKKKEKGYLQSDFRLKIRKEKIKFPDNIPYGIWISKIKDTNGLILFLYLQCGICGHFTKNVKTCDECSGEFNVCSSHKYHNCNLCMECGIKCKLCKNYSSMRFENPLNTNSNKRQLSDQYKKIDLCCYCVDRLSIRINDITSEKYIALMIIEYIKE